MPWNDPVLPAINVPHDLRSLQFRLGSARYSLLPNQYIFSAAQEEFVGYISGVGGGKTRIGSIKSALLSMHPNNRGLVGRFALPDLEDTAQRDLLDFLKEAELLKEAPNAKSKTAIVHCVDPITGRNLGYTSEIGFQHLDDPDHLRGRHLGWFWIDEGSELRSIKAWTVLVGRLRLPTFRGMYKGMVTGNPRGRNWIYDFFFNDELLKIMTCGGRPGHHVPTCLDKDNIRCNRRLRLKRRAVHSRSYDNYYLPPDYIENMVASYTDEQRRREVEAEFDVFEGQVFKEFNHEIHVVPPHSEWTNGRPPKEWKRLLAVDVGGSSPWAFEWVAVDPWGNLIFYDEISKTTSNVDELAEEALPKMGENGAPYDFQAKVIDYENKIAAADMEKRGIRFTNARKMNKSGDGGSVSRLSSYLHPNHKHAYPPYHPLAGQMGSPRAFFVSKDYERNVGCPNLIRELPQQQWDQQLQSDQFKDVMDRNIRHDAVDCALYITREMPHPATLPVNPYAATVTNVSKMAEMYYYDVKRQQEKESETRPRQPYRISHVVH